MKIRKLDSIAVPDYALNFLTYGEDDNLSPEDQKIILNWSDDLLNRNNASRLIIESSVDQPYFTWKPVFGLPCNVIDCDIILVY